MRDYTLALGDAPAYGFSAADDGAALAHAVDYLAAHGAADPLGVALAGPDGILTRPDEDVAGFRERTSAHHVENTDDVRPGDPTPPDCNTA